MKNFPIYHQFNTNDCGPTCLRMVAKHHGKALGQGKLRQMAGLSREGVNLLGISEAAENLGFRTRGVQLNTEELLNDILLPCILHWNKNHFVVIPPQKAGKKITVADPAKGMVKLSRKEFEDQLLIDDEGSKMGTALLLEPTAKFYEQPDEKENKLAWRRIFVYLTKSKWQISQVFIALLITSGFQMIFPFFTQSLVDSGISAQNMSYITIVLVAQLMLVFSRTIIDFIRSRLLMHISVHLNFSLLSDFWIKLTRLPISYFDAYHTGDTLQRLGDSKKIESFLTGATLNTFFSLFNFVIFGIVLMMYNSQLFFVFSAGSLLYFIWVRVFLRFRRRINYQMFHLYAEENNASLQLVQEMQELKLNSAEHLKRWEWEDVQTAIYKLNFRNLSYSQLQQTGALFLHEGKNIVITFLVAQMVVQG